VTAEWPPLSLVRRYDTHRLIPSKYGSGGDSVLARIANSDDDLAALFDLESATNDRLLAEQGRAAAIGPAELVAGVPYASIINAAFTHAHPLGSRFNGPDRGAWYAGFDLLTSQAEVIFHKTTEYAEIRRFFDRVSYDDYLADVSAELHDLRAGQFANCLSPTSYVASQALAERLLAESSLGIIYPSVRRRRGICVALFQPSLVANVRKGATWRFTWSGSPTPEVAST
jgi:hypothetical protein